MNDESRTTMLETNEPAKRHKRGDVREDGMVFIGYVKASPNGERWLAADKYAREISKESARKKEYHSRPEVQAARRLAENKRNKDPAVRRIRAAKGRALRADPVYAEKLRETARKKWADDAEFREAKYAADRARVKADPLFAMAGRLRRRNRRAFARGGFSKKESFSVGCSWGDLKIHIEDQFTDGMCWERFSEIHLDHIIPLSSAKTPEEIIALNHYSNIQPLWKVDNLRKGAKILN